MTLSLRPTTQRSCSTPYEVDPERLVCEAVRDLACASDILELAHWHHVDAAREAVQSIHDRLGALLRRTPHRLGRVIAGATPYDAMRDPETREPYYEGGEP